MTQNNEDEDEEASPNLKKKALEELENELDKND